MTLKILLRVLVLSVLLFVGLLGYRASRSAVPPASSPAVRDRITPKPVPVGPDLVETTPPVPPQAEAPPPSPECAEVLKRIRSCSGKDLEAVVDGMAGADAAALNGKLSPADRRTVLSNLPRPLLARKARELLGIPEYAFKNVGQPGLLASSLVEIATGTWKVLTPRHRGELSFALSVGDRNVPVEPRGAFRPSEGKLYACWDGGLEPKGVPGVLVRWVEESSGALIHFHWQPFNVNSRWNYVFFEPKGKWSPGNYRVSFYQIGEPVFLLAEGTYVVGRED